MAERNHNPQEVKTQYFENSRSGDIYMSIGRCSSTVINLRSGNCRHLSVEEFSRLNILDDESSATLDTNIDMPYFYRSWHAQSQLAQSSPSRKPSL